MDGVPGSDTRGSPGEQQESNQRKAVPVGLSRTTTEQALRKCHFRSSISVKSPDSSRRRNLVLPSLDSKATGNPPSTSRSTPDRYSPARITVSVAALPASVFGLMTQRYFLP